MCRTTPCRHRKILTTKPHWLMPETSDRVSDRFRLFAVARTQDADSHRLIYMFVIDIE